jgi:hypothetical protein
MKIFCRFFFLSLALLSCAGASEGRVDCFVRFNFCVTVPPELANNVVLSDNGDGGTYSSEDGVSLSAWGSFNSLNTTIKAEYSKEVKDAIENRSQKITYQKLGDRYYVLSGYQENEVFYQMVTLGVDNTFRSFLLRYPSTLKNPNALIADLFKQFKQIAEVRK